LCCGVTPFAGTSTLAVIKQHAEQEPGRPNGIPDPLWDMISWLLKKSPRARPQSAQRVAAVLDTMVDGLVDQPVATRLTAPPVAVTARPDVTTQLSLPTSRPKPLAGMPPARLVARPPERGKKRKGLRVAVIVAVLLGVGTAYVALRPSSGAGDSPNAAPGVTTTNPVKQTGPTATKPAATTVAELTTAPDLIGKKLADAQDMLPATLQVDIVDSIQQGAVPGTVVAQDPKPNEPLHGKLKVVVARDPVQVHLDELRPVKGGWSTRDGASSIASKTYLHSVGVEISRCTSPGDVEYNVSKGFRRLGTTAGIDDNAANSEVKVQLEIYGDGRQLASVTAEFGKPTPIDLDLSGVLRLRLHYQPLKTRSCYTDGFLVLGEATLFGLPGEVPTSAAPTS
jgi:hypothetical protein